MARKGKLMAFVEVKLSRAAGLGPPESRVTRLKQARIATAASEYLSLLDEMPEETRFDVIAITWPPGKPPRIDHIESAFTADD